MLWGFFIHQVNGFEMVKGSQVRVGRPAGLMRCWAGQKRASQVAFAQQGGDILVTGEENALPVRVEEMGSEFPPGGQLGIRIGHESRVIEVESDRMHGQIGLAMEGGLQFA